MDVDRFAPHGGGIGGFLGHAFGEVLANYGSGPQNIRGLRYEGFPQRFRRR